MARSIRSRTWESYFKLVVESQKGGAPFALHRAKIWFMRSAMQTLTSNGAYLDVVCTRFISPDRAEMILGSFVKYDLTAVDNLAGRIVNDFVRELNLRGVKVNNRAIGYSVEKTKDARRTMSAFNTTSPKIFRAIMLGRRNKIAFPDDFAKNYYISCLKEAIVNLPVEIAAYSITANGAYFAFMSLDQTPLSIRRYLHAANKLYIKYYLEQFAPVGNLFESKIKVDEIDGDEVFDTIALIHAQPSFMGLSQGFGDYKYSSYSEKPGAGLSCLELLSLYFRINPLPNCLPPEQDNGRSLDKIVADRYNIAHNNVQRILLDWYVLPKKTTFDCYYEQALAAYKVYDKDVIPRDTFAKVLVELNELSDYSFDEMFARTTVAPRKRYMILADCAKIMLLDKRYRYDQILRRLGIEATNDAFLRDLVIAVNFDKGYSYDYIMSTLGLAYPNLNFLKRLLKQMLCEFGMQKVEAVKKLGLYDTNVISQL